jgi:ribose 5-phosphate isomerase A
MSQAIDDQKRAVGVAAAALVQDKMTVGLGTGSTAAFMVEALGARAAAEGLSLRCVATSRATEVLAAKVGLPLIDLDEAGEIDLTLDGADEIGPGLSLIKGGGAALLREKLVWEASRRCVAIADQGKHVAVLGAFPLPVEVVAFGHLTTARRIGSALEACGISTPPRLRVKDGQPVMTDGGNVIYDLDCRAILKPADLALALKRLTGVVEHGLFLGLAKQALVGTQDGVIRFGPDDAIIT